MKRYLLTLVLLLAAASYALAGVCPQNGHYSRSDIDADGLIPQAGDFSLERHYSSFKKRVGVYGEGWASDIDKAIEVGGDGALLLHDPRRHKPMRYYPGDYSRSDLERSVARLIDARYAGRGNLHPDDRELEIRFLIEDTDAIDALYRELFTQGRIEQHMIPLDTAHSYRCTTGGTLYRTAEGYALENRTGSEAFDQKGRLVAVRDVRGQGIDLKRDADGRLLEIVSENGSVTRFAYTATGRLQTVTFDNRSQVNYRYNTSGQLESVDGLTGDKWAYRYAADGRLQIVENGEAAEAEINYDGEGRVATMSLSNDEFKTYRYQKLDAPRGQTRLQTDIRIEYLDAGESYSPRDYRYVHTLEQEEFGDSWISNKLYTGDGYREETAYVGECKPAMIDRNGRIKQFSYDKACQLEVKETDTEIIRLSYDPVWNKITRVETVDKASNELRWTNFEYSHLGNLQYAENSRGRQVSLTYNSLNQIASMTDENEQTISFEYNKLGKPVLIDMPGKGSIEVAYDAAGEIASVESEAGHKMALAVTRAFQNLLGIVKPAGVNLD